MTPAEMREVLLEGARWWANQPAHSGSAQRWVTFFEQLPEDNQMLVGLSGGFQDLTPSATGPILKSPHSRCGTCTAISFRSCHRSRGRYLDGRIELSILPNANTEATGSAWHSRIPQR